MRIADRHAPEQRLQGIVHVALLDAEEFEPVLVDGYAQTRTRLADGIVDVDDERHGGEDLLHFACNGPASFRIRAVDLGQKRRQHRRTRRDLDDLDARSRRERDLLQALAQIERDLVAGAGPLAARGQIELQLAELDGFPHVVVAHQPVEIEGGGRARIGLDGAHLRQPARNIGHRKQRALGILEARPLGQIEHDGKLRLVVEGKQLHGHRLRRKQRQRHQGCRSDAQEKPPRRALGADDRGGQTPVEGPQRCLRRAGHARPTRSPCSEPGAP